MRNPLYHFKIASTGVGVYVHSVHHVEDYSSGKAGNASSIPTFATIASVELTGEYWLRMPLGSQGETTEACGPA